jgi:drug/metabolite transporter (DMT)-like permease
LMLTSLKILGLAMVLLFLGAFLLALHNVLVRVVFQAKVIFGSGMVGGWLPPDWPHSFLFFQMRTLMAVGLMIGSAPFFYPNLLQEGKALCLEAPSSLRGQIFGCGSALFLALCSLYWSLAQLPAGVATTTFFMYPAITVVLVWLMLGERPTYQQGILTGIISMGVGLVAPGLGGVSWKLGVTLLGGLSYAYYGLQSQCCLAVLHPVLHSFMTFSLSLGWGGIGILMLSLQVDPENWLVLWGCGGVAGLLVWGGYLCISYGIQRIGVSRAFLISAVTPVLTTLLAWISINETLTSRQIAGVIVVVLGLAALGLVPTHPRGYLSQSAQGSE